MGTHEETSFGDTEEDPTDDETRVAADSGCADGDDTPRDHDSTDPLARGEVLHPVHRSVTSPRYQNSKAVDLRDVTREFTQDILQGGQLWSLWGNLK